MAGKLHCGRKAQLAFSLLLGFGVGVLLLNTRYFQPELSTDLATASPVLAGGARGRSIAYHPVNALRVMQPPRGMLRAEQPPTFKDEEVQAINRGDTIDGWDSRGRTLSRYPPRLWPAVYNYVVERGLKAVSPAQAQKMVQDQGAVVVDVRVADATIASSFDRGSIAGSLNVPLFRKVQGWSFADIQRRAIMTFFGMEATETNPDFEKEVLEKLTNGDLTLLEKPVIIVCDRGGQIEKNPTVDKFRKGPFNTRSLKAAYELYQAGFNNLYFLDGGLSAWENENLPMDIPDYVKPTFTLPAR